MPLEEDSTHRNEVVVLNKGHNLVLYVQSNAMEEIDRMLLYRQVIAAISRGDTRALCDILAPDLVDHNPIPKQSPGRQGFIEWMNAARSIFPDLWGNIEDVLLSGDYVIGRVTWHGTQRGPFAGLPPTQKPITFDAIHISRFGGPKIAEWWGVANLLTAIHQLGGKVVPEEPEKGSSDLEEGVATTT